MCNFFSVFKIVYVFRAEKNAKQNNRLLVFGFSMLELTVHAILKKGCIFDEGSLLVLSNTSANCRKMNNLSVKASGSALDYSHSNF